VTARSGIRAAVAVLLAACVSPTAGQSPQVKDVTVFAAASLTDAFTRAGNEFARDNARVHFIFSFGSSSTLATQLTNGARADVFASADEETMRTVVDADLADGAPTRFASNRLRIAVAPGNPKRIASLADLARADIVLVLAAPSVPAGKYAQQALAKAGVTARPVSQEVDVRAVLNKVALGEADAGIVYVTDVISAGARVSGVDIPESAQVVALYPAAVLRDAKSPDEARAFVGYLVSPEGRTLLASFGFSPP
jgi:molybdate transport system substrate-binding protein